ncbi:hypothetical protein HMPREF1548_05255 [Clostridium sp. KLE 1755]|nr:hypothetical protein HMPREF1548_05255 [Clostridium sp. KLE 1755]
MLHLLFIDIKFINYFLRCRLCILNFHLPGVLRFLSWYKKDWKKATGEK